MQWNPQNHYSLISEYFVIQEKKRKKRNTIEEWQNWFFKSKVSPKIRINEYSQTDLSQLAIAKPDIQNQTRPPPIYIYIYESALHTTVSQNYKINKHTVSFFILTYKTPPHIWLIKSRTEESKHFHSQSEYECIFFFPNWIGESIANSGITRFLSMFWNITIFCLFMNLRSFGFPSRNPYILVE